MKIIMLCENTSDAKEKSRFKNETALLFYEFLFMIIPRAC